MVDEATNDIGDEAAQDGEIVQKLNEQLTALKERDSKTSEAMEDLQQKLEEAQRGLTSEDFLEYLEGKGKDSVQVGGEKPDDPLAGIDVEYLSNKDLAAVLVKANRQSLEAMEVTFNKQIEGLSKAGQRLAAQLDLELACVKYPDLNTGLKDKDYVAGFRRVVEANPQWNAEKVYRQLQMETRMKEQEKADQESEQAKREREATTEKGGVPSSMVAGREMTEEEAVNKAAELSGLNALLGRD